MSLCKEPKPPYDFKNEYKPSMMQIKKFEKKNEEDKIVHPECVEEIIQGDTMKTMFAKWSTLKRVKEMYDEQVTKQRTQCFRVKILKNMKKRIAEMPPEERKVWLTKLIRLAFLNKLKEIRDIKKMRTNLFLERIEKSKGEERDKLFEKLAELKDLYELKELDDVNEILQLKKAKKDFKMKKAKELEMKIRLKRLKKLDEIRRKEEESMRKERVQKVKEIVTVRKNWQEEMVKKIDGITKKLADELVRLEDKKKWYDEVLAEVEEEKNQIQEDEQVRRYNEELAESLKREKEMAKIKRDQKLKEIEVWKKERKIRLWKMDKVKAFEDFLESRYIMAEGDENVFFKKIFNKLTASERKKVEVDPWDMKPKMGEREKEIARRKKLNNWIQSIVSSTKQKVVNKVRLKKYLEAMETPQLDQFMSFVKRIESVNYIMCVIRGRILRNTFPDNSKDYIAKEFNKIITKTKLDIRDIDPTDKLLSVQLTTKKHDLYINVGNDFLIIAQQIMEIPEEPCQDKTDVLCITAEERDKMLEIIRKRQQSRKVVKETRQSEYEAYQNRKALDDAWMKYMKKAYEEALRDVNSCKRGEDVVKIDVQSTSHKEAPKVFEDNRDYISRDETSVGLTEEQIQALVLSINSPTKTKKEKVKMSYSAAMDKRAERLITTVMGKGRDDGSEKKPYYARQQAQMKDVLQKEKVVREHMIKDLPEDEEY